MRDGGCGAENGIGGGEIISCKSKIKTWIYIKHAPPFFDNLNFFQKHAPPGSTVRPFLVYGGTESQLRSDATVKGWQDLGDVF